MTTARRRTLRRVAPPSASPAGGVVPTRVERCSCGTLTVTFEADDRVLIETTKERGAGWLKLSQWVVCSHCDTEIRIAPMPCWVGKIDGNLWTTPAYAGAGIEGNKRSVPPRAPS